MSLTSINTALSGLNVSSLRQTAAATNIARAGGVTAADPSSASGPVEVVSQATPTGVRGDLVSTDPGWLPLYDPSHPSADGEGNVYLPNISLEGEMVNMIAAEATYMANLKMLEASEEMQDSLLDIVG